ncbi:hypothetical protein CBF34_00540 [Vagococcus penaei]|uniref:WCX domain-containing protein n=1 Tax=Vagococcus penaei TaxID=633807 RepID=A0A1Q2D5D0_9ENTE|nr:WYL domain-containing protein [Vagococcus penaei]AQP53583.1 hypothetical protein BW732_04620 [Vagococcus penaei]RSU07528.1 hypothetical protein CBF34_00540 [Vagococcus penaei]
MNGQARIVDILLRLLNGECLTKAELMGDYQKQDSTIQRDMAIIEDALQSHLELSSSSLGILNRENKGQYYLEQEKVSTELTDTELLAIVKILCSVRIFNKEESDQIIEKLVTLADDPKQIQESIKNERFYYQGIIDEGLLARIEFVQDAIVNRRKIEFSYTKNNTTVTFQRIPTAIYFADLYFFMLSASHTAQDDVDLSMLNKFRINNMVNPKIISSHNKTQYRDKFEAGILRNQTVLPFLGNPTTIVLDFYYDPAYVLDRFPESKIIQVNEDGSVRIKIKGNDGYGVKMWALGQGDMVKVIAPQELKDYITQNMLRTLKYYDIDLKED